MGLVIDHAGSILSFELRIKSERELELKFRDGSQKSIHVGKQVDMCLPSVEGTAIWVLFHNGSEEVYDVDSGESFKKMKQSGRNLPQATFYN